MYLYNMLVQFTKSQAAAINTSSALYLHVSILIQPVSTDLVLTVAYNKVILEYVRKSTSICSFVSYIAVTFVAYP